MPASHTASSRNRALRLWPGVVAVAFQWAAWSSLRSVVGGFTGFQYAIFGAMGGAAAVVLWWLFFSRAAWIERLGAVALMAVGFGVTAQIVHPSLRPAGGLFYIIHALPLLSLAFVAWAASTRRWPDRTRRWTMAATILVATGGWALVRSDGISGNHFIDVVWRWAPTPEGRLLADGEAVTTRTPSAGSVVAGAIETAWPGFRGPDRDGVARGVRIGTDWDTSPPIELWRRPVGPGWSSFAVAGDFVYTQEQRGDEELVSCYHMGSGEPVWFHRDAERFWETNAGAGPRATPTFAHGRIYTVGATGVVNALDARDGRRIWSANLAADTDTEVPDWGFSASPLIIDDLVVVAAAGRMAAYDAASGALRWTGPEGGKGYSSPHRMEIDGVPQLVMLTAKGAYGVFPTDGSTLWEHEWDGFLMTQPAQAANGDVLIGSDGIGTRRLAVTRGSAGWNVEARWTSIGLKPYFNDVVVHEGHAYGFDGRILASIDLAGGDRNWKGGRYGHGQLVLLPEQDLLLVLTEKGELALVSATPEGFDELARVPAIEGKTWNHPTIVPAADGHLLLVRNGAEMVAFRLPAAGGA